jgi:uracil-DNA glycosylase family 4
MTPRQRAMLDEMGIKLFWWPRMDANGAGAAGGAGELAKVEPPVAVDADAPSRPAPELAPSPVQRASVPAAPPAVEARAPIAARQGAAAVLSDTPRRLFGSEAASEGGWLIIADMPPELDGRHGEPFAGDAGRLLHNMLRALQLQDGEAPVHLMRTHRGVVSGQPTSPRPLDEALADCVPVLAPRLVLALGPLAAQTLMQSGDPLGKLRGRVVPVALVPGAEMVPVVATYHPAYLLRNPLDKARAWADLCLAAEQLAPSS